MRTVWLPEITVTQSGTSLTTTPNYYGVLSTQRTPLSPALPQAQATIWQPPGQSKCLPLVNAAFAVVGRSSITTSPYPRAKWVMHILKNARGKWRIAPYTWSVASGSLPAGLALAPATESISGTPTAAGTSTFAIQVADSEAHRQPR